MLKQFVVVVLMLAIAGCTKEREDAPEREASPRPKKDDGASRDDSKVVILKKGETPKPFVTYILEEDAKKCKTGSGKG
jgi:hypothetical protein